MRPAEIQCREMNLTPFSCGEMNLTSFLDPFFDPGGCKTRLTTVSTRLTGYGL